MDMNYMKRRSIFDPVQPSTGNYPAFDFGRAADEQGNNVTSSSKFDTAPSVSTPNDTSGSRFSKVYSDLADEQGGPNQKKFTDFLQTGPKREDFKPGKLNRISAILAGVSEGANHGGASGFKAAQSILDDPYNEAQNDWATQGKKLEAASGIEEKDMGRRVGILKDIIAQDHQERADAETARSHKEQEANYAKRTGNMGLHYADITEPNTGVRSSHVIGPNGPIGNFSLGKAALTPDEQVAEGAKKAGANSAATVKDKINVAAAGIAARGDEARKTADHKFSNIQDLLQWKQDNGVGDKYEGRVNKDGKLVYINKSDPTDFHVTDIDTGKMSDADKQKAKIELKQTAPADSEKKTNLTRDKNGKVTSADTVVTHPNVGKIKVTGPDGTPGTIDASELEEALKHGYKKR